MKLKITLALLFLFLAFNGNAQVKSKFTPQLTIIKQSFGKKNIEKVKALLADGYTIKGIPKGAESIALQQILEQFPPMDKYTVVSEKKEKDGTRVVVKYLLKEKCLNSNFLFDAKGKIKEFNVLENASINAE